MKLIVAILSDHAARRAERRLAEGGVTFTRLASSGDILENGNTTLLIGAPGLQVAWVLNLLRQAAPGEGEAFVLHAQPVEHELIRAFPWSAPGRGARS